MQEIEVMQNLKSLRKVYNVLIKKRSVNKIIIKQKHNLTHNKNDKCDKSGNIYVYNLQFIVYPICSR